LTCRSGSLTARTGGPRDHQAGEPGGWSVEAPPETLAPAGSAIGFDMAGGDPARPQLAPDHVAALHHRPLGLPLDTVRIDLRMRGKNA
jgi:hypothetical protein